MNNRQRAKDLLELAFDDGAPEPERLSALVKAGKLIVKYDLLSSPLSFLDSENETLQAAKGVFETLSDPTLMKNLKKIGGRLGSNRRRRRA
jgi:hypothetical protein